jgi:hypothetical protein
MTTQRAIVKATAFGTVQIRNMYTAEVVETGGDTAEMLWHIYLDAIYTTILSQLSTGFVTYAVELQERVGAAWVPTLEYPEAWTGTGIGDPLPNAVAMVLIGKGAGLRHVGRKFFGPIAETTNIGNTIAAGVMVILSEALLNYVSPVTGIGGGSLTPGVLSKTGTFYPFVGGIVSSLLGSMRRRKPGIGI